VQTADYIIRKNAGYSSGIKEKPDLGLRGSQHIVSNMLNDIEGGLGPLEGSVESSSIT
jgi:hypothetical protein